LEELLRSTSVQPFRSPADAARKLEILADNRSPLLASLFLVAANTRVTEAAKSEASASVPLKRDLLGRILPVAAAKPGPDLGSAPGSDIARIFEPVRQVVPPDNEDRLIGAPNREYVNALASLKDSMQALAGDSSSTPNLALHQQAQQSVQKGLDAVRQIAQQFNIRDSQGVDIEVKRLLESPFREAAKFIISDPSTKGSCALLAA
jgi:type VI protein secretion system component VasK